MSYDAWQKARKNCMYAATDVIIRLILDERCESEAVEGTRSSMGDGFSISSWSLHMIVFHVVVVVMKPETSYCGKCEVLETYQFGEYTEDSYLEGKEVFARLVAEHLEGSYER